MTGCCKNPYWILTLAAVLAGVVFATSRNPSSAEVQSTSPNKETLVSSQEQDEQKPSALATFGGGCFWCVEAVFQEVEGVEEVVSGYMGGHVKNPTYEQVCSKTTGHAEVVQVKYDPEQVSFKRLLEVFFATHDPTTLNRQGNDYGPQYRSVVFYHSDEQKRITEAIIEKLNESGAYDDKVVTEVSEASTFYKAEKYHQDYFANNPNQGYCRAIIAPKMAKFRKAFADDLKNR